MDEPNHPRLATYTKQHTLDWSARVDAADAFVFVMAEYNHSYTARSRTRSTTCCGSGRTSRSDS